MLCCEAVGGAFGNVLLERSKGLRYIELNSGSLKISVSSWMYNLSIYFECVLVLTYVSHSVKILL